MLGVSVETLRRWETDGRLRMERSEGGQRLVDIEEVARLLDERRKGHATARSSPSRRGTDSPGSSRGSSATASRPSSRSSPGPTAWSA